MITQHMQESDASHRKETFMMRLFKKYVVPVVMAIILLMLFNPVYCSEQGINYFLVWILIGLPFGLSKMSFWIVSHKMDLSGSLGVMFFELIIAGMIGGVIAIWYLLEITLKTTWLLVGSLFKRKNFYYGRGEC